MSKDGNSPPDGDAATEHHLDIRVVLSLSGRYILSKRRGVRRRALEYACRLVNISPAGMVLAGPVAAVVGEPIITYFAEFGTLEGVVTRTLSGGFVMTIDTTEAERAKLAAKLAWLEKHGSDKTADARAHQRIVPRHPHSTLILADGTMLPCFVVDMSASGAAVSAEVKPPVGMPLTVGSVAGKVVRRFAEGFAVQFTEVQDTENVEALVIKSFARKPFPLTAAELDDLLVFDGGPSEPPRFSRVEK